MSKDEMTLSVETKKRADGSWEWSVIALWDGKSYPMREGWAASEDAAEQAASDAMLRLVRGDDK